MVGWDVVGGRRDVSFWGIHRRPHWYREALQASCRRKHARFQIVTEWQPTAIGSSRRGPRAISVEKQPLGRIGSLGDTCSKETEVETYRRHGAFLARGAWRDGAARRGGPRVGRGRRRMLRPRPMKIYDSFGPNPRALRMFLLEKGVDIPKEDVDLLGMENRRPPYTDRNPGGQLPSLEMENGRVIGETVAIFEYLEEKHPDASPRRLDAGRARRDALLAAARRAAHHRARLQRLPVRRGDRSLPSAAARAARSGRRPQGDGPRQSRLARRPARGEDLDRRRPVHHRRRHPLLRDSISGAASVSRFLASSAT